MAFDFNSFGNTPTSTNQNTKSVAKPKGSFDFNSFGEKTTAPKNKSILGYIARDLTGKPSEDYKPEGGVSGFVSDVYKDTLGSGGISGLAQAPLRPIQTAKGAGAQEDIQKSRLELAQTADKFIAMAGSAKDPEEKKRLLKLANDTLKHSSTLRDQAEEINKETPQSTSNLSDIKRVASQAINTGLTLAPFAKPGLASFKMVSGDVAKKASLEVVKKASEVMGKSSLGSRVAKGAIEGAKYGAGFGAANKLANDGSIADVAKGTLTGAALGAATTAALPIVGAGLGVAKNAVMPSGEQATKRLENVYNKIFTATKSGIKTLGKSEAAGKNPAKFLAEKGYFIDVVDSKYNTDKVVQKLYEDVDPLEKLFTEKLKTVPKKISLRDLEMKTLNQINNPVNRAEGTLSSRVNEVKKVFAELRKAYGARIDMPTLNEIKVAQAKVSGIFDATKPKWAQDVNYQISKVARKTIENEVKDLSVKDLNNYIGRHLDAINILKKVNGNAAKGGRLGQYFGRVIGGIAGASMGGPIGTVGGVVIGDKAAQILSTLSAGSPILKRAISKLPQATPEVVAQFLNDLKITNPKVYEELAQELSQSAINQPITKATNSINENIAKKSNFGKRPPEPPSAFGGMTKPKSPNPKGMGGAPKNAVDPLLQEAKKYKSAEEFVNSQPKLYRGGTPFNFKNFDPKKGLSLTTDKEMAIEFTKTSGSNRDVIGGKLEEIILDPKAKIATFNDIPKEVLKPRRLGLETQPLEKELVEWAKANSFDAIDMNRIKAIGIDRVEKEIRVVNPGILKTKSQLTDLWNKANKMSGDKKYKSVFGKKML